MGDVPKVIRFGQAVQLGPRVGDGDEVRASFFPTNLPLDLVEEILLENVGLGGASGFRRHDEKRFRGIHFLLECPDLGRYRRIENEQFRKTIHDTKGAPHHLGPQTGSAHSQEEDVLEAARLDILDDGPNVLWMIELAAHDVQPA